MAIPFDYSAEYKRKLCTPDEAARVVKSGDWIDISMGGAFPSLMDAAIARRKDELRGVKVRGYLIFQPIQMVESDPTREHFIYNSWHLSGYERKLCDRGLCNFIPMVFRNLGWYYTQFLTVNVAIMCVTPMNEHGYFNFSVSNASARAVLDKADIVILEVNENLPWVYGGQDECIHISDVNMIVEGEHSPLPNVKSPAASEAEMKIAEFVVQNMADGSTLQLGIGAIPDAVLLFLKEKNDLGIHTEMFSDGVVELAEAGNITNQKKTLHRGQSVATFLMGTRRLYDYVDNNPAVAMYPVQYVNDPYVIAQNDNLVSINSCVQIDLMGQVVSTSVGLRQISGVGGQIDFVRGANMSKGGRAIMAMPSTTGKGKVSKIVPFLDPGSAVTTTRNDVNYVITEYGIAQLRGKTLRQRAEALIEIAHPDFRDALREEYRRRFPRTY